MKYAVKKEGIKMDEEVKENTNSRKFFEMMAIASWICPLIIWPISITAGLFKNPILDILCIGLELILIFAGFTFGIIALISMQKYGKKKIFGNAIAGLSISAITIACIGILAVLLLPAFLKAKENAKKIEMQKAKENGNKSNNTPAGKQ